MYKEVAFDPSCMADIEYYNLVKQHFGFEKGRYIAAEIKSWAREAMALVKESDLKPIRKQSVKNYLNRLGHSKSSEEFLLTRDRQVVSAACWRDWVDEQQKIRRFSFTIAHGAGDDVINIDRINDGCVEWDVPASISIDRGNPKDIIAALSPLLVLSNNITIVDQYFLLPGNKVLAALFHAIGTTSVRSLRIATTLSPPNILNVYNREFRNRNVSNIHFEWIKAPSKYFHDRYVITDAGAVRSGQGFMVDVEKGTHSDLANINIIGQDEASRTLHELEKLLEDRRATVELSV